MSEKSDSPSEGGHSIDILASFYEWLRSGKSWLPRSHGLFVPGLFGGLGVLFLVGGIVYMEAQTVLLSLGGTGLFAAVILYSLSTDAMQRPSIGEYVHTALGENERQIVTALELSDNRIYVPIEDSDPIVRLYIPRDAKGTLPTDDVLQSAIQGDDYVSGVSLRPSGEPLFREFEQVLKRPLSGEPLTLVHQLTDGLVEQYEIVQGVSVDILNDRAHIRFEKSTMAVEEMFDHPIASFLAVGVARGLDQPVTVTDIVKLDRGLVVTLAWWPHPESYDAADVPRVDSLNEERR